mgnify:CR=1 FL=1
MNSDIWILFMKRRILLVLTSLLICVSTYTQVVINEFMSLNNSTIEDEDGEYNDWIEIYNAGSEPMILTDYSLSDDSAELNRWTFPEITIANKEHLLIFASGKNRLDFGGGWENLIHEGDIWKYKNGENVGDQNWINTFFDDHSWDAGPSPIGYDHHNDATIATTVGTPIISLYARNKFNISDLNSITEAKLHIDYDDSFVAYLNGNEIARSGIGTAGDRPLANQPGEDHESVMYSGGFPEAFAVNVSYLIEGENTLAIEVHNAESTSSDMVMIPFFSVYRNIAVSDDPPEILQLPPGKRLHTNFKIKSGGESLYLSNPSGTLIDSIPATELGGDISYGRTTDGAFTFSYFDPSTPGNANFGGSSEIIQDQPEFAVDGGYFSGTISVTLTSGIGGVIRYTTDGTIPTSSSPIFSSAISLSSSTVIKARITDNGKLPGPVATRSYIDENDVNDLSLPMISISADPDELFYDPQALFNFQPGENEKQVYFELYNSDKSLGFKANAGVKIFGNESGTGYDYQQSLALFARSRYGDGSFDYRIFREKSIDQFEAFILRNNNSEYALFDGVGQGLNQDILDVQAYQPVVLFINGQYWGILNMMEKINEHYVAENYNIDPDSVDILNGFETSEPYYHPEWPIAGTIDNYAELTDYLRDNDLSNDANYNMVKTMIDIDYFATYQNSEIYMDNNDWPGNNTKFWRHQGASGKWRWILFDIDAGLGAWTDGGARRNTLEIATEPFGPDYEETWPNPPWSTFLLRSLLENGEFENLFIATMCDLMATNFKTSIATSWVANRTDLVEKEISNHGNRWRESTDASDLAYFQQSMNEFLSNRRSHIIGHYKDYFGLSGTMHDLKLDVPESGGIIRVNNRNIESYPYTGQYFEELEITLTAIPNRGFEFEAWMGTDANTPSITLSMSQAQNISAQFKEIDGFEQVMISEVNYLSSNDFNTGDWIELLNASDKTVDLSGWMITDKPGSEFIISPGTELNPGECLVICKSLARFIAYYPDVRAIGNIGFGLSKRGDRIQLYNDNFTLIDEFEYKVVFPWPEIIHDAVNTIAMKDANKSNSYYGNWKRSAENGTPGEYVQDISNTIPDENLADQMTIGAYPNPFTSSLTIDCVSEVGSKVHIILYDLSGRIVTEVSDQVLQAGYNRYTLQTDDLVSGVYFISIKSSFGEYIKKVISAN